MEKIVVRFKDTGDEISLMQYEEAGIVFFKDEDGNYLSHYGNSEKITIKELEHGINYLLNSREVDIIKGNL